MRCHGFFYLDDNSQHGVTGADALIVIPNALEDIAKMAKRLSRHGELDFCYEAGGYGYAFTDSSPRSATGVWLLPRR